MKWYGKETLHPWGEGLELNRDTAPKSVYCRLKGKLQKGEVVVMEQGLVITWSTHGRYAVQEHIQWERANDPARKFLAGG